MPHAISDVHSKQQILLSKSGKLLCVAWVVMAVSFLVWPFSLPKLPSQALGLAMLLPIVAISKDCWPALVREFLSVRWGIYILVLASLLLPFFFAPAPHHLLVFSIYLLKVPVLFVLAYAIQYFFKRIGLSPAESMAAIWLAVSLPLLLSALQASIPAFHSWTVEILGGFRLEDVIDNNAFGHAWRLLGPNGFLFASHSVAFGLSAIGLLLVRPAFTGTRYAFVLLAIELACLFMCLLSGRSGLPLVAVYLLASLIRAGSWRKRGALVALYIAIGTLMTCLFQQTPNGRTFLYWLTEPVRTSLERGHFASNSFDVTLDSLHGASPLRKKHQLLPGKPPHPHTGTLAATLAGHGVYFQHNSAYLDLGIMPSDSGFVRMIFAFGYIGLILFLSFWAGMALGCWRTPPSLFHMDKLFCFFFLAYGLAFFIKSEWLYQNFFIFYFFSLYLYLRHRPPSHAHHLRQSISSTA